MNIINKNCSSSKIDEFVNSITFEEAEDLYNYLTHVTKSSNMFVVVADDYSLRITNVAGMTFSIVDTKMSHLIDDLKKELVTNSDT